jgi:molecular chaperone DnaK (HSP70)
MNSPLALVTCRQCGQWPISDDDAYCGACGRLLLPLEIVPDSLVLISAIAPAKELTLRNVGPRPLSVSMAPRGGAPLPGIVFDPGTSLQVPSNESVTVRIGIDAQNLPIGFHRVADYVCTVDGDSRKQRTFQLDVRSGPSPRLSPRELDFEDVEEGKAVERTILLTNEGSVPLRIASIRAVGSSRLRLLGEHGGRLVRQGETLPIAAVWQSTGSLPLTGAEEADCVRFEFVNHPDVLLVPATARMYRYRLDLAPPVWRTRHALAKREYTQSFRLENHGTTDVEITSIESDQPWIHVVARAATFTLLSPASAAPVSISPTTFARGFDFRAVCRPTDLGEGKHQGNVIVRPHGQEPLLLPVELTVVEPKEYHDYIGIDFGTTNSVVAVLSSRTPGAIELVKDELSGKELIPSVLVFDDAETYKIGQWARNEADTAPDRTVRSIKRVMGFERDRTFFDRSYSAGELASLIIRKLVQLAEEKLHADSPNGTQWDIRKAIITVPANFHDLQIRDVLRACARAGLETEDEQVRKAEELKRSAVGETVNEGIILDEPAAAVLYYIDYLRRRGGAAAITEAIAREQGLRLLVFDYGGGTLDVAVASVTLVKGGGIGLRILTNLGDNDVGGDHIDVLMMKELLKRCQESAPHFEFDPGLIGCPFKVLERRCDVEGWSGSVWREILRVRAHWKDLAEQAKMRMAERKQVEIEILPDLIVRVRGGAIERAPASARVAPLPEEMISNLLQPVLVKCEQLVRTSLADARTMPEEIDYILHTGRQSLLPHVRRCVRALFPNLSDDRDLLEEEHLKVCVAKGAALYGFMRHRLVSSDARITFLSEGRRLPHSYGVEKFTNPFEPEFDEVIPRGMTYPIERTKSYAAEMIPVSGRLNLKFYQNTGKDTAILRNPEVSLIGQISIDTAGRSGCDVKFAIGANRTLQVFANEQLVTIEPARLYEEESWTA